MRLILTFILLGVYSLLYSQAPTKAASNIVFSNVGCNEFTVSWTNGSGSERAVFIRKASAFGEVPEKDEFYNSNSVYGLGESIKTDLTHFCVYRGTGTSVTVTGLKSVTTYYIAVFEYNAAPPKYDYLTSGYPTSSVLTQSITADFSLTPLSQCQNGNSIQFTNKSVSSRSPLSYEWNFNDGSKSTATDPKHSHPTYGIYRIRLVANAPGCADTTYRNDTINPHPVAVFDLDPSKLKNDSIQCFYGNRFTFRNSTTLASLGGMFSSTRYIWYMDNGFIATGHKADRAFPQSGVFPIKLVAISNKGCMDSTYKIYVVRPRAIDTTQVFMSPKSMCLSNNLFDFENKSPLSITSRWRFGDGGNDSLDGFKVKHSYQKIGKYKITLKAMDAQGCLDVYGRDSVSVFSNTKVSYSGLKPFYCINEKLSFLKPQPGKGEFFGTNVNTLDSSFTPASLGKFYVGYVYTKGGCRDTVKDSTIVYDRPKVNLGPDTVICVDRPLQLNVNSQYATTWFPSNSSSSSININSTGTYSVRAVEGNCDAFDTIVVRAITAPKMSKLVDTTLCGGSYLKFNFKVDLGNAIWRDGSNLKDRVISQTGFYHVTLANKCGSVSDSFNLQVEETACVIFFPNAFTPNGDLLNDSWQPFGKYDFLKMSVFNRWGEKVYTSETSPVWDGYKNKELCLDGVYSIVFEYLIQDGNSQKRVTKGLVVHLIR